MKFTIIPFEGTDILKLGLTREENDKSEAIKFFEPTEIIFNNLSLIKKRYHEVLVVFEKLDEYLDFEELVGFVSKKYDLYCSLIKKVIV